MARPWMPLYVADYLADTNHLSTVEHGAYMLLIMHYWQRGSLPKEDARLASIARASLEQWHSIKATLVELFDENWTHKRIEDELVKAKKAHEKRVLAGKMGGKAKASNAVAMLEQCSTNHNHNKEKEEANASSKKKRATRLPDDWQPDFEIAAKCGLTPKQAGLEALKFRNYWLSKSGKDATKLDWQRTWHNWCLTAAERLPRTNSQAQGPPQSVGELARLKLRNGYGDETGNGYRQIEGVSADAKPAVAEIGFSRDR